MVAKKSLLVGFIEIIKSFNSIYLAFIIFFIWGTDCGRKHWIHCLNSCIFSTNPLSTQKKSNSRTALCLPHLQTIQVTFCELCWPWCQRLQNILTCASPVIMLPLDRNTFWSLLVFCEPGIKAEVEGSRGSCQCLEPHSFLEVNVKPFISDMPFFFSVCLQNK